MIQVCYFVTFFSGGCKKKKKLEIFFQRPELEVVECVLHLFNESSSVICMLASVSHLDSTKQSIKTPSLFVFLSQDTFESMCSQYFVIQPHLRQQTCQ